MDDLLLYIFYAVASSLIMYHLMCGSLQFYYYVRRRDSPEEWKCQPNRFLTRSNELHEVVVGTATMTIASVNSGLVVCWIANGNYNKLYFDVSEYGYAYLLLSVPALFFWIEAAAYYVHR